MNIKRVTQSILYGIVIIFFAYTLANKALMFDSFLINIAKTGLFQCKLAIYAVAIFALLTETVSITLLIYMLIRNNTYMKIRLCRQMFVS